MIRRITLLTVIALLAVTIPAARPGEARPGNARNAPRTTDEQTDDKQKEDGPKLSQPSEKPSTDKPSSSKPSSGKPSTSKPSSDPQPADDEDKPETPSGSPGRASRVVRPEQPSPRPREIAEGELGTARRNRNSNPGGRGTWTPPTHPPRHRPRSRPRWVPPPHPPHGRRGQWRRDYYRYHGSWMFLIWSGPIIYCPPPRPPRVVRLPRSRYGIYVRHSGSDQIGRDFANEVRQEVRARGLKPVYTSSDAAIELYIVSMDEDPESPGWGSSVSVSFISHPGDRFITTQLLDVGDEVVGELADYVADYTDDLLDDYCR